MTYKEENFKEEQRTYCNVRALLGFAASDTISNLDEDYEDSALSYCGIILFCFGLIFTYFALGPVREFKT